MEIQTIQYPRKLDSKGYVLINVEGIWEREHVFVVKQFIGRELTKNEVIHHIDFNRQNNDIDNLVIFPDVNSHSHFHRQVRQFNMTKPRLRQIQELKLKMI